MNKNLLIAAKIIKAILYFSFKMIKKLTKFSMEILVNFVQASGYIVAFFLAILFSVLIGEMFRGNYYYRGYYRRYWW